MTPTDPIIDIHVHLVGIDVGGCYLAPAYRRGVVYKFLRRQLGLSGVPENRLNEAYIELLQARLDQSGLDGLVLLAFDAVYDWRGVRDLARTTAWITNDYLFEVCARDPRFLPAPSINPRRRDALGELDRVNERGAVCIKTVPNSQDFDPADPAFAPFWRKLADLGIPWLTHTGKEHTIPVTNQAYGEPRRLVPALEAGVTVIAAHAGTGGFRPSWETFPSFVELVDRYPNLYGDISALGSLGRARYLLPILDGTADGDVRLQDRLIYGSDYPVPSSPWRFAHRLGLHLTREVGRENILSTPLELMKGLGVDREVLERGWSILRLSDRQRAAFTAGR